MVNREKIHKQGFLIKEKIEKEIAFAKPLIYGSAKVMTINILHVVFLFCTNYFLVKLLGEQSYGEYIIINLWVNFFSVVMVFGMDDFFILTLPKIQLQDRGGGTARQILLWSLKVCTGIFAGLFSVLSVLFYSDRLKGPLQQNQSLFFMLLFGAGIFTLLSSFLRGINKVVVSQVIEKITRPAIVLIIILIGFLFQWKFYLSQILVLQVSVIILGAILCYLVSRISSKQPGSTIIDFDKSGKTNFTFLGITLLYLLSTRLDMMVLSGNLPVKEIGYYNVSARISDLAGFPLVAINLVIPTMLSREYHLYKGNIKGRIKNMMLIAFVCSLVAFVIIIFFGKYALSFFGQNFMNSYWPMIILSGTHLFSSLSLPLNSFLMISGRQKISFFCLMVNVVVTLLLCYFLIPLFGIIGAAFSILGGNVIYFLLITVLVARLGKDIMGQESGQMS